MAEIELDARHLICPMPVLKARKALIALDPGEVLLLRATDPASRRDVPAFCAATGHVLLGTEDRDDEIRYRIRKGPA
jgi:tRNA 2-thiouridine synthesizing protein A